MASVLRISLLRHALALFACLSATPGLAFTDADLTDGFQRTVFGSEYPSWGWQSNIVKKFTKPVRVYIDDRSGTRRGEDVERFVRSLPRLIEGLQIETVAAPTEANFRVFVIDRKNYRYCRSARGLRPSVVDFRAREVPGPRRLDVGRNRPFRCGDRRRRGRRPLPPLHGGGGAARAWAYQRRRHAVGKRVQ